MKLTFFTAQGESYFLEVSKDMLLGDVKALVEADSGVAPAQQQLGYQGKDLTAASDSKTLEALGLPEEAVIQFNKIPSSNNAAASSSQARQHYTPTQMEQMRQYMAAQAREYDEMDALEADPYDVEAQKKIEERIRLKAVMENFEHAVEHQPDAFGSVIMLYVDVEVNGHKVKAFVDSGAQSTIISPDCAERCGILRLLDTRFSGMAQGVGTAKILGRIHSAMIKMKEIYLPVSFTVLEGKSVDLLFGLDMLKRHQACIDLSKGGGCLRIQGVEVPFLAEHELPKKDRADGEWEEMPVDGPAEEIKLPQTGASPAAPFPGAGKTFALIISAQPIYSKSDDFPCVVPIIRRSSVPSSSTRSSAPTPTPGSLMSAPSSAPPVGSKYSETAIKTLIDLGVSNREEAIARLDMAGGNVDVAASSLF